jgi:hypothetical protein
VIIVAIVKKYLVGNVHTDYEDGTFEWFDTTQLCIVEPAGAAGRVIDIEHNEPQHTTSPWRRVGAELRLEMEVEDIETLCSHSREYFSAGIRILSISPAHNK